MRLFDKVFSKTAKWLPIYTYNSRGEILFRKSESQCSKCGNLVVIKTAYCGQCGRKMRSV